MKRFVVIMLSMSSLGLFSQEPGDKNEGELDNKIPIVRMESDLGVITSGFGIDLTVVMNRVREPKDGRDKAVSLLFWIAGNLHADGAASDKLSEIMNWCLTEAGDDLFCSILLKHDEKTQKKIASYVLFEWVDEKEDGTEILKKYPKSGKLLLGVFNPASVDEPKNQ